ncbi:hypothetical protein BY996DRAFT_6523683 [Phakopsora pachyrhizi]|nr:hypothetical protein BY996DRAFT_6523683 [Phakopsora pachyrhizi]
MLKLAEKMMIICKLGKMIVDEVLIYRSLPAQRSLTKVIFNPSSSNAGNNRMKQNPESTPPLPPNSSDLAPPNCLGLHPNQQFSSGLATELPPLYFRSNIDDLTQDEGLPKTNLVASTLSLPYAMDASDTQSMVENLTKLLTSHPHSENIDYLPSFSKSSSTRITDKYEATSMFGKIEYIDDVMGRVGLRELLMEPIQRVTCYILIFKQLLNLLETLISVFESELFKLITNLEQQFSEFSEAVTELFDRLYSDKSQDSLLMNQSNEIVDFLQVISWIGSGCSRLNKRFKQPTFGPGSEHDN